MNLITSKKSWLTAPVLAIDRLPANLRDWGIVNLKQPGHEAGLALLQSYLMFARKEVVVRI